MLSSLDIRAIARRAVGRLREQRPSLGKSVEEPSARRPPTAAAPLVTSEEVAAVPDGARVELERGARVTPLAQEEAWRRGIRFVPPGGSEAPSAGSRRIALGSDHGGFELKQQIAGMLVDLGWRPLDLGTHDENACDYPDFARAVAEAVASGQADFGVVVDGAGIGSAMAANKVPGVLAANCWDERSAVNAREHNHANVLSLGAGHLDRARAHAVLRAFLETPAGPERHARRVAKIRELERRFARSEALEGESG